MRIEEGYVKYNPVHHKGNPPWHKGLALLDSVRTELYDLGLIGEYGNGISYGNISIRNTASDSCFVISGTGTGKIRCLGDKGYCLVTKFDIDSNIVESIGPLQASSESLTHGAIYMANRRVQCVIHVHSRMFFNALLANDSFYTPDNMAYGTPELAVSVINLVEKILKDKSLFVTKGHENGIFIYAPSIIQARDLFFYSINDLKKKWNGS
jgi:Ribulose-5-phosphate 4-epimerase and related epimerases and aldolases